MVLRERREYFLSPKASFEFSGLDFLVKRWRERRRRAARGSGFKFSGSLIVWGLGARKVLRKRTVSVVGYNFKIEECLTQKLCLRVPLF